MIKKLKHGARVPRKITRIEVKSYSKTMLYEHDGINLDDVLADDQCFEERPMI